MNVSAIVFVLGGFGAFAIAMRYNLVTRRLVGQVQAAAAAEGRDWEFWERLDLMTAFPLKPSALLEPQDTPAMAAAKQALLDHRKSLWRNFFWGAMTLFITAVGAVRVPMVLALVVGA